MNLKDIIRKTLIFFHADLTKNLKYDRLTRLIMKRFLKKDSNCMDIGAHKGEILKMMLKYSPKGKHFAFEPIPYLYEYLSNKYGDVASIYPFALSDEGGEGKTTEFNLVKNAPAYSGIKQRRYDIKHPRIEKITVEERTLDQVMGDTRIDFIKIDVEGGEFGVLKGAEHLLKTNMPTVLFECGKGASDFYGTRPEDIFNYITNTIGLRIFTLEAFINSGMPFTLERFVNCFEQNEEYYYIASR